MLAFICHELVADDWSTVIYRLLFAHRQNSIFGRHQDIFYQKHITLCSKNTQAFTLYRSALTASFYVPDTAVGERSWVISSSTASVVTLTVCVPAIIGYRDDNRVICCHASSIVFVLFHKPSVRIVIVKMQYIFKLMRLLFLLRRGAEYCSCGR